MITLSFLAAASVLLSGHLMHFFLHCPWNQAKKYKFLNFNPVIYIKHDLSSYR
jgi:hypothetical protein